MRKPPAKIDPRGGRGTLSAGSSGETGPFQQTLAMAILEGFQTTHGTQEARYETSGRTSIREKIKRP
jgi:hypothetical protein